MKYPMTTAIAARRIRWHDASGNESTLEVCFGMPSPLPRAKQAGQADAYCPYQIKRFKGDVGDQNTGEMLVEHQTYGVDAVQALYHALTIVGVELGTLAGSPHPDDAYLLTCGFPTQPSPQES